jgi:hypothetical protein
MRRPTLLVLAALALAACSPDVVLTERERAAAQEANLSLDEAKEFESKNLYEFEPKEIDRFLGYMRAKHPDLRDRVQALALKNVGQPYDIYLLGEYPFEIFDEQPLFCLGMSDCVVFSEHTYAMALAHDWKSFFAMLQRIRYKNGVVGYTTRNHYTEADWTVNNSWLIENVTEEIAGETLVEVETRIDRAAFFAKSGIETDVPVQDLSWSYLPREELERALPELKTGDFVNIVRGATPTDTYVGHVGLISVEDGVVYFVHSTTPEVKKQTLVSYRDQQRDRKNPQFYGFRFFRLQEDALENLREIDGPRAPKITVFGEPE